MNYAVYTVGRAGLFRIRKGDGVLKFVLVGVVLAIAAVLAYVRFAPSDPARWHVDIAAADFVPPVRWAAFCPSPGSREFVSGSTLAKLADVAEATPRTTRLAGSVAEGRITWITRSRLFGFPDYATAATIGTTDGPQLCIVSRQRFGSEDGGVNAAKLQSWLIAANGYPEPPALAWKP